MPLPPPELPRGEECGAVSINQDMSLAADWVNRLRMRPGRPFHVPLCLRFDRVPDPRTIARALQHIVARHSALRMAFHLPHQPGQAGAGALFRRIGDIEGWRDSLFAQRICPGAEAVLTTRPLPSGALCPSNPDFRHIVDDEIARPFDLSRPPLMRTCLVTSGSGGAALLAVFHHLVCDGWSVYLFMNELTTLCGDLDHPLTRQPASDYQDFVRWQRTTMGVPEVAALVGTLQQEHLQWLSAEPHLAGSVADIASGGHAVELESITCDAALSDGVRAYCRTRGCTPYALYLAVLFTLCCLRGQTSQVAIWGVWANRLAASTQKMIGWTSERRLLGMEVPAECSFADWTSAVQARLVGAGEQQYIAAGAIERGTWGQPTRNARARGVSLDLSYRRSEPFFCGNGGLATRVRLPFTSRQSGVKIFVGLGQPTDVDCVFPTDELTSDDARVLLRDFVALMRACVEAPERPLAAFANVLAPA